MPERPVNKDKGKGQQYGDDGRIVRESTFWNDVPAFQALGLPVLTVHYWDADFDPSALVAS